MIDRKNCYLFGKILKLHGYDGEMMMKLITSIPQRVRESEPVFLEIEGILVPFFVSSMEQVSPEGYLISFDWIDSDSKARGLVGCQVYAPASGKKETSGGTLHMSDFIGFSVIDRRLGHVGTIMEFIDIPQNPLFQIQGSDSEILIPANPELIREIRQESFELIMDLPEGLLDV